MQQVDGYIAGIDYPAYPEVPKGLSFSCKGRLPGYYAVTKNTWMLLIYFASYSLNIIYFHFFSLLFISQDIETRCQVEMLSINFFNLTMVKSA